MEMNYINEINAFYQRQETNPVSAHAMNLWHTLLHVNYGSGWKKQFTVMVAVLCSKGNLSINKFKRARRELQDKGYITYQSQQGKENQSAIYEIISSVKLIQDSHDDPNNHSHKEILPDWFINQHQVKKQTTDPVADAKVRLELQKIIAKYVR